MRPLSSLFRAEWLHFDTSTLIAFLSIKSIQHVTSSRILAFVLHPPLLQVSPKEVTQNLIDLEIQGNFFEELRMI